MADWITVESFLREGMSFCFLIGLAGGLLISAVVMLIRSLVALFKHIVRS